ncbi:MAG: hypothetical protein DWQ54_07960 [Microcystis flos-aquae TF09]|uniref:Uncharacterized protein n=1 Tax=Microcystis flos-aquae TF09 TaxID=2060473 RepID=A0A3E0L617_9CHRO|nr:MAG: hypothetical protein DWQ54_07960 [Microcystis flos-aquae TF09]
MTESRGNNIGIFALRLIIDPTLFGDKSADIALVVLVSVSIPLPKLRRSGVWGILAEILGLTYSRSLFT